jgi:hypothetical protein
MKRCLTWLFIAMMAVVQPYADECRDLFVVFENREVRLGMPIQELGRPEQTSQRVDEEYGKPIVRSSFSGGLVVESLVERPDRFFRIILTTSELSLSNGLRVGINREELLARLGTPAGSGVFKGRQWVSYACRKESGEIVLLLNAFMDAAGQVAELRLVVPGDYR